MPSEDLNELAIKGHISPVPGTKSRSPIPQNAINSPVPQSSSYTCTMSPGDAPTTSPLAGEEGPGIFGQSGPRGTSPTHLPSPPTTTTSFNLTCMTCHTHFTSAEQYARHHCVSSQETQEMNESSGDVEQFDGKIVYNPDGSAYIIDSEMSEDETASLDLPRLEGSIEDSQRHPLPASVAPAIPPIANAIYVTKNSRAFYSALYGQTISSLLQETKVPEVPIVHNYRVFNVGDKESETERTISDNKKNSDKKPPVVEQTQVPIKPILMCFICKLSFGYVKSFIAHAMGDHNIILMEEEKDVLSTKNASAIIQNAGREKEPRVSFLEPVSTPGPIPKGELATHLPSRLTSGASPTQQSPQKSPNHLEHSSHGFSSPVHVKREEEKDPTQGPDSQREESGTISVKREFSEVFDVLRQHQLQQHQLSLQSNLFREDGFSAPQSVRTPDTSRKSPISSLANGRASLSPVTPVSPNNFSPLQSSLTQLTGTVIGACPEHMSGRAQGISCEKCDMILQQSRQIGGQMSFMHSRNSCKTLKCPKCNWHYKYQETLEIHMKEKHPESESNCIYCLTSQPHPRLARGETYTCGYKPYRCEVCNYSTTTKGNLSIHMQSDKHLNNMQELQNGGLPSLEGSIASLSTVQQTSPSASVYSAPKTPTPSTTPAGGASPGSHQKPKPMWRCDVCNYETNVARNLRIHMTSEKHTHNMMVLQQNVKQMQQLNALQSGGPNPNQMDPITLLQYAQNPAAAAAMIAGMGVSGMEKPPVPEAALADMAYNQALLIQMMTGGQVPGNPSVAAPPSTHGNGEHIGPHFDLGMNPESLEPPPEPVPPNPKHSFSCCVCSVFHTDSLEQLNIHLQMDRSKLNENEVLILVSGNYICKLCSYKTNLKANFQLHCKTDKHLQKLQHVNHILEGGHRNEWKLKFLANTNPMHMRCNLCEYYTNSVHKLQLHASHQRHEVLAMLFRHLCNSEASIAEDRRLYKCMLCTFSTKSKLQLLHHIRSMRHLQMEQLYQIQRHAEGKGGNQQDIGDIFRVEETDEDTSNANNDTKDEERSPDAVHACPLCSYTTETEGSLQTHIETDHSNMPDKKPSLKCPLCEESCSSMELLERHALTIHSVNSEGLQRLLILMRLSAASKKGSEEDDVTADEDKESSSKSSGKRPLSDPVEDQPQKFHVGEGGVAKGQEKHEESTGIGAGKRVEVVEWSGAEESDGVECEVCKTRWPSVDLLEEHHAASGHLSPSKGSGYECWKKGCNQHFSNAQALHAHFTDNHGADPKPSVAVSEKHVYKYRCQQCSLAFKTVEKLQLHSQYHAIRDATKCLLCHRNFRSLTALQKHVSNDHPELSDEEKLQFQASIFGAPVGVGAGPVLDPATTALLRRESNKTEESNTSTDEDPPLLPQHQAMEDFLNTESMAMDNFNDVSRKYKCQRCRVAYTRQLYLSAHQKTLLHRKEEKLTYPMEKYLDPNRPYKCDVCKESYTQKNILLVHYNSVSHLHKLKKIMQEKESADNVKNKISENNESIESSLKSSISPMKSEEKERAYRCNLCKVSYAQQPPFDAHLRSVLHQSKSSKINDLTAMGLVDSSKPLIEQPSDSTKSSKDIKQGSKSNEENTITNLNLGEQHGSSSSCTLMPPPLASLLSSLPITGGVESWVSNFKSSYSQLFQAPVHNLSLVSFDYSLGSLSTSHNKKLNKTSKSLLQEFGFDLVAHEIENSICKSKSKNKLSPTMAKTFCRECNKEFSNELIYKVHLEKIHNIILPLKFIDNFANELREYLNNKQNTDGMHLSAALPDTERSSRDEEMVEADSRSISDDKEREMDTTNFTATSSTPAPRSTPTPTPSTSSALPTTPTSTPTASITDVPTSSPGAGMNVSNMAEMAAALNALTSASAAQMQQMPFHPMMMAGLGLAGLPLHLNPLAAMNLQPPLLPMMPHHMFDPSSIQTMGNQNIPGGPASTSSSNMSDPASYMKQQQHQIIQQQHQQQHQQAAAAAAAVAAAQQKRARTRITDEQLKVLRGHFDINNSPSEEQINEMAKQSGLPPKVIKHWFRNTLFKERQRCKDSPYNFSIPPSTSLNIEEYEKTGEAKVMQLNPDEAKEIVSTSKGSCSDLNRENSRDRTSESPKNKVPSLSEDTKVQEKNADTIVNSCGNNFTNLNNNSINVNNNMSDNCDDDSSQRAASVSLAARPFSPSSTPQIAYSQAGGVNHLISSASSSPLDNMGPSLQSPFSSLSTSQPQLSIQSLISSQLENNPLMKLSHSQSTVSSSGLIPPSSGISPSTSQMSGFPATPPTPTSVSSVNSGKRANRTRFTDYQIKVLQEFFENNAYPKDDDLEYLSKLLTLSPRVIVVWFQNARQKARKVYENQPPIDHTEENTGRFTRTPGLNYQCKKCLLVFQRYYELIRHQKTHCFKEEDAKRSAQAQAAAAQAAALYADDNSNNSSITESSQHSREIDAMKNSENTFPCDKCSLSFNRFEQWREHQIVHLMNPALFLNKGNETPFAALHQPTIPQHSPQSASQSQSLQQFSQRSLSELSHNSPQSLPSQHLSSLPLQPQTSPIMMPSPPMKRKTDESEDEKDLSSDMQRDKRLRTTILPEQLDYLYQKYQMEANPSRKMLETIAQEVGLKKRVVQVWFQNTRARERKGQFRAHAQVINKKCPFCPAIFKVKSALESHLSTKHADQYSKGDINIDALPDVEDAGVGNFGLSSSASTSQVSHVMSSSLFSSSDVPEDPIAKYHEEAIRRYLNDVSLTSDGLSGLKREGETPLDLSKPFDLVKPLGLDPSQLTDSMNNDRMDYWSDDEGCQLEISETDDGDIGNNSFESNPTSPASSTTGSTKLNNHANKRFRTQMSGVQVKIMKVIFRDYKTPTMGECEMLGREIGLAKRVVQVWFQNARAKEKKAKLALHKVLGTEPEVPKPPEECRFCNFTYSHKYSIQDHIFTRDHIDNLRKFLERLKEESDSSRSITPSAMPDEQRSTGSLAHHIQMAKLMALGSQAASNSSLSLEEKNNSGEEDMNRLQLIHQMYQQMKLTGLQGATHPLLQHAMMAGAGLAGSLQTEGSKGTPLALLQVPSSARKELKEHLSSHGDSTASFTLDGENSGVHWKKTEGDVGWVCKKCTLVFSSSILSEFHQKVSKHDQGTLRLAQILYGCTLCSTTNATMLEHEKHIAEAHSAEVNQEGTSKVVNLVRQLVELTDVNQTNESKDPSSSDDADSPGIDQKTQDIHHDKLEQKPLEASNSTETTQMIPDTPPTLEPKVDIQNLDEEEPKTKMNDKTQESKKFNEFSYPEHSIAYVSNPNYNSNYNVDSYVHKNSSDVSNTKICASNYSGDHFQQYAFQNQNSLYGDYSNMPHTYNQGDNYVYNNTDQGRVPYSGYHSQYPNKNIVNHAYLTPRLNGSYYHGTGNNDNPLSYYNQDRIPTSDNDPLNASSIHRSLHGETNSQQYSYNFTNSEHGVNGNALNPMK